MKETSLRWLAVPAAILLVGALVTVATSGIVLSGNAPQCSAIPVQIGGSTSPGTLIQALEYLVEVGVVPSIESAVPELTNVGWVLDPADDYRLEYWLSFGNTTVGFKMLCVADDLTFIWEYDGIQEAP